MKSPMRGQEVPTSVGLIQGVEKEIVEAFLRSALAAGYQISVDDGEGDYFIRDSTSFEDIQSHLYQMDLVGDETFYLTKEGKGGKFSWLKAVYGGDGWDVISDYSIDLEPLMEGEVKRLIEKYS